MNARLAAQTLSSSVVNAIEFLDISAKHPSFVTAKERSNSSAQQTDFSTSWIAEILPERGSRHLYVAKADTWKEILTTPAKYLLPLKTNTHPLHLLRTTGRKTFITGFVTCIKSTISMANQMLYASYQHIQVPVNLQILAGTCWTAFSCIRARGGWNNNPNCLQFKYAPRKMLLRNAITASKNANCVDFTGCNSIIPLFHVRKHKAPASNENQYESTSDEIINMSKYSDQSGSSEFTSNVLFYVAGYVVSKLLDKLPCFSV